MNTFENFDLRPEILKAVAELGFETPMPVQEAVIPRILHNDKDLIALAQTGTGKTAAFGLPLLQLIDSQDKTTQALILSPTRELCMQIASDLHAYAKYMPGIKITPIYGGAGFEGQVKLLKAGTQIIVATPGRMLDMINRNCANLSAVRFLVLDEADEMLDMGFEDDVRDIIESTPAHRHTYLFSATMPEDVEKIALRYMSSPETVSMGQRNAGASNVKHIYYLTHAKDRYSVLKRIADFHPEMYAIVFCRTRQETQEISDSLIRDGYNADALHGDLSQAQRDHVMGKFREKLLSILVATDVAARGIDVSDLTHVINYNLPDESENYIHRSGRTGRAGKDGISISIINLKEKGRIKILEKQVGKSFSAGKIPSGRQVCEKQLFHLIDRMENVDVIEDEINDFLPVIYKKLQWMSNEELIKRFVSVEFNSFLDYYRDATDLNVNESHERAFSAKQSFTRVFMSIGRKDGLIPPKLLGLINDYTRNRDVRVGRIEIGDTFTFVEISSDFVPLFMESFKDKYLNDRPIRVDVAEGQSQGRKKSGSGSRNSREQSSENTHKKFGKNKLTNEMSGSRHERRGSGQKSENRTSGSKWAKNPDPEKLPWYKEQAGRPGKKRKKF